MGRLQLIILIVGGIAATAAAGDLWICCDAGIEVSVDAESVGACKGAKSELRVTGLEAGDHLIRLEGQGGLTASFELSLGRASTQAVIPELVSSAEGDLLEATDGEGSPPLGTVEITSNPRECEIDFGGWKIRKRQPIVLFLGVPVGEYDISFTNSKVELGERLTVLGAQTVRAMADFSNQRVAITAPDVSSDELEPESGEPALGEEAECVVFWIQVMRTDDFEAIEPMQSLLRDLGFPDQRQKVITIEEEGAPPIYKLRVGPIERANTATWAAGQIRNAGIPSVWILPQECDSSYKKPKRKYKPMTSGG